VLRHSPNSSSRVLAEHSFESAAGRHRSRSLRVTELWSWPHSLRGFDWVVFSSFSVSCDGCEAAGATLATARSAFIGRRCLHRSKAAPSLFRVAQRCASNAR
jgi:hypothetical protein